MSMKLDLSEDQGDGVDEGGLLIHGGEAAAAAAAAAARGGGGAGRGNVLGGPGSEAHSGLIETHALSDSDEDKAVGLDGTTKATESSIMDLTMMTTISTVHQHHGSQETGEEAEEETEAEAASLHASLMMDSVCDESIVLETVADTNTPVAVGSSSSNGRVLHKAKRRFSLRSVSKGPHNAFFSPSTPANLPKQAGQPRGLVGEEQAGQGAAAELIGASTSPGDPEVRQAALEEPEAAATDTSVASAFGASFHVPPTPAQPPRSQERHVERKEDPQHLEEQENKEEQLASGSDGELSQVRTDSFHVPHTPDVTRHHITNLSPQSQQPQSQSQRAKYYHHVSQTPCTLPKLPEEFRADSPADGRNGGEGRALSDCVSTLNSVFQDVHEDDQPPTATASWNGKETAAATASAADEFVREERRSTDPLSTAPAQPEPASADEVVWATQSVPAAGVAVSDGGGSVESSGDREQQRATDQLVVETTQHFDPVQPEGANSFDDSAAIMNTSHPSANIANISNISIANCTATTEEPTFATFSHYTEEEEEEGGDDTLELPAPPPQDENEVDADGDVIMTAVHSEAEWACHSVTDSSTDLVVARTKSGASAAAAASAPDDWQVLHEEPEPSAGAVARALQALQNFGKVQMKFATGQIVGDIRGGSETETSSDEEVLENSDNDDDWQVCINPEAAGVAALAGVKPVGGIEQDEDPDLAYISDSVTEVVNQPTDDEDGISNEAGVEVDDFQVEILREADDSQEAKHDQKAHSFEKAGIFWYASQPVPDPVVSAKVTSTAAATPSQSSLPHSRELSDLQAVLAGSFMFKRRKRRFGLLGQKPKHLFVWMQLTAASSSSSSSAADPVAATATAATTPDKAGVWRLVMDYEPPGCVVCDSSFDWPDIQVRASSLEIEWRKEGEGNLACWLG